MLAEDISEHVVDRARDFGSLSLLHHAYGVLCLLGLAAGLGVAVHCIVLGRVWIGIVMLTNSLGRQADKLASVIVCL